MSATDPADCSSTSALPSGPDKPPFVLNAPAAMDRTGIAVRTRALRVIDPRRPSASAVYWSSVGYYRRVGIAGRAQVADSLTPISSIFVAIRIERKFTF